MKRHFEKELANLKTALMKMASLAEEATRLSIAAFLNGNTALAERVIGNDEQINSMEIEIDNSIVDLLALQQPVAVDLRFILAAQKINNDLERIGDHAVNIAQSAITFTGRGGNARLTELPQMVGIVESMLRDAIDGFIRPDASLGMSVLRKDDVIDEMNKNLIGNVIGQMKEHPELIEAGIDLIRVSRNLERVADLATNIAEEVIFIAQARIVKHHAEEKEPPPASHHTSS
jgi:phosphate transport system protein